MGEARRASVRGLSTARQELNLIPRKAPSRLTNRLVRTRMLGGVRGRGLAAPSYSIARISGDGAPSPKPSLSAFFPEDRDRKSGKTEAEHTPRQMEMGFAVRGSGSPPRLSEENHPVRKSASRSPFSAGRKRARKRFFAGSCAITGQRPRPRQTCAL